MFGIQSKYVRFFQVNRKQILTKHVQFLLSPNIKIIPQNVLRRKSLWIKINTRVIYVKYIGHYFSMLT